MRQSFFFGSREIKRNRYLGILDSRLSSISHIGEFKRMLSKRCVTIEKPRNIRPFVEYGVLVYGFSSYSFLLPIYLLQKKIDSSEAIFLDQSILIFNDLHVYELIKLLLKQSVIFLIVCIDLLVPYSRQADLE